MPSQPRKLIGLTGMSSFSQECMDAIEEFFDANFVLLYHGADENTNYWLEKVDAVILAGGVDIHPSVYGESDWNNHNLGKFDTRRDNRELQILEYCLKQKKPLFGICRGHQLIGLRHGFPFMMDLSASQICHQPQRQNIQANPKEPVHNVKIINPEIFYGVYQMPRDVPERKTIRETIGEKGKDRIWVNSFHHQGLIYAPKRDYAKDGIDIIGTAFVDLENCKYIVELMQGDRWISCQWHPEFDWKENTASRIVLARFKAMIYGEA